MTNLMTPGSIPVSALIGAPVEHVGPDAPLREVARALTSADVGVVVISDGGPITGVVSERDLTRAIADDLDLDGTRAVDVAHAPVLWCDLTATVAEVAAEMMEHWVRHVVVEQDGRPVGVVSARDLLGIYASDEDRD
jgi:signal-transduction protein with cAMP-binding, CBS, and nucleotidyltransferase domain